MVVEATDEVGNPTILATFTVIAAILPDGLRARDDGAVHEPHPHRGVGGHAVLAGGGLHGHPLGGGADLPPRPRGEGARRGPRGLVDAPVPPGDDSPGDADLRALGVLRVRGRALRGLGGARGRGPRQGQDAALRQQERVPGDDRPPRGDAPRGDARDRPADEGPPGHGPRGQERPALRGQRRALQLQRPRPALLPAPLAPLGRPAGEPRAQARPRRPEPRHRQARAPGARRDREGARGEREGGGDPARASGHGHDGGRDLRSDAGGPPRGGDDRARPLRDDGRGGGRPRLDGGGARARPRRASTGRRRASRASPRWPRWRRWPVRGRGATWRGSTRPSSREPVPVRVRLSAADRASRERRLALRVDSPMGGQVSVGELARVERGARAPAPGPEGPEAGRVRHGRPRRREGEPGLRDPRPQREARRREAARRGRHRAVLHRGPGDLRPRGHEVGRRVADHLRGLPRPRHRLRGGARPHRRARGGVVPVVRRAPRDPAAHPPVAHRHPARALGHRAPSSPPPP